MREQSEPKMKHGVRRRAREMALQLLFQHEFIAAENERLDSRVILRRFVEDFAIEADVADYGGELFLGVLRHSGEIDSLIQKQSAHWKLQRMGLVDLSIMRVATFEMKFLNPLLAPNVAINEAIELAKKYGTTESGSFVNGILDHLAKSL